MIGGWENRQIGYMCVNNWLALGCVWVHGNKKQSIQSSDVSRNCIKTLNQEFQHKADFFYIYNWLGVIKLDNRILK